VTAGILYVVATPIGNLADWSPRAREVLTTADLIAAEDTRHTRRLLNHFNIATAQQSLHEHNEQQLVPKLLAKLQAGQSIALVSDAGTPLVSDPGYRLVNAAQAAGVVVSPIPGPCALTAALSAAGLPTDRFCFEGFLPAKQAARRERIVAFAAETRTVVIYESVHRLPECVADLAELLGSDRQAFIGREISKQHEQCRTADLATLKIMLADGRIPLKGEFVLIIAGSSATDIAPDDAEARRLLRMLMAEVPGKRAADLVADILGRRPNDIYRLMLEEKNSGPDAS
jgi:16S rRNA (cytidine1402-2'-O)-methyltransferase